jgi:hypothetical protein
MRATCRGWKLSPGRLSIAASMLALAACDASLKSNTPLLTQGEARAEQGLWALLDEGCAQPTGGDVQNWPECAAPVWLGEAALTGIYGGPRRSEFILAAGNPMIASVGGGSRDEPGDHYYYAVRPEGSAPYRAATVWTLPCAEAERVNADADACVAKDEAALRRAAATAVNAKPTWRAVLVRADG